MKQFLIIFFSALFTLQNSSPLQQLVDAERAFALLSREKGTKQAFLQYLDDYSVLFTPYPVNGKELYSARGESQGMLEWKPTRAKISSSGDFGYTTGPWKWKKSKDENPSAFGYFVSVWKKNNNGDWKVLTDAGNSYEQSVASKEQEQFTEINSKHSSNSSYSRVEMLDKDNEFSKHSFTHGFRQAIQFYASEDIRLYREKHFPVEGRTTVQKFLSTKNDKINFNPLAAQISSAGDLGFTYGFAVDEHADSNTYIHIWEKENEWKLVLELLKPIPHQ